MFLEETGDTANAAGQFKVGVQLFPAVLDSPFFTRNPDLAKTIVQRCLVEEESKPDSVNDPVLRAKLGKLYLYMHDLNSAQQTLEEAARDLPNLLLVWFNFGELYRFRGDQGGACLLRKCEFFGWTVAWTASAHTSGRQSEEIRLATQRWMRMRPVTAAHNNRLYHGILQQIDDLLPTTLVWYLSPCEASAAYSDLAKLHPDNKTYAGRTRACEEIPDPHGF